MQAVKGNRQYNITEEEKEKFMEDGFDIFKDGEKVASGRGAVSKDEYDRVTKELEAMKKVAERGDVIAILKEYATMKGIDIGQAGTINGIMKKLKDGGTPPGGE